MIPYVHTLHLHYLIPFAASKYSTKKTKILTEKYVQKWQNSSLKGFLEKTDVFLNAVLSSGHDLHSEERQID